MAIGDDFSVNAAGDIRHVSGTATYTVLELHRWLQDLADDQQASGNDLVDITVYTPSERATDQIITLQDYTAVSGPNFNIDDTAAQFLYDGSITQKSSSERYSGLQVVGAVESGTQLQIVQNGALLTNYWGTGLNADAGQGILLRILVKTRADNVTIDGGRVIVQARELSDSYAEFAATLGLANGIAAIFTGNDLNNQTAAGTIATWDQFTNTLEGYQLYDIDGIGGTEPYYSRWNIGGGTTPVSPTLGNLYEWTKYQARRGTAANLHGLNGELFRGITHEWAYDGGAGTAPATNADWAWGLNVAYTGQTVNFSVGEAVWFNGSSAIRGRILAIDDNGATGNIIVAMEAGTPADTHTIAGQTSGGDGTVSGAPTGEATGGGLVRILAQDGTTTGTVWIQLLRGTVPLDNYVLWNGADVADAITVQGSVTTRTVSPEFIGQYTGSNIIGAFGLGVDPADAVVGDLYTDLLAATHQPPNNVTFNVGGLISGEDRVLVTWAQGSGIDFDQLILNTTLAGATETAVVVTTAIPTDTPQPGTIRVELDSGIYKYQTFTSFTGSTFTIPSTSYSGDNATAPANVFISYIDKLAASATESFTVVYTADRTMFVRVRDGGTAGDVEGIKTFETTAALNTGGGGTTAIRTPDV